MVLFKVDGACAGFVRMAKALASAPAVDAGAKPAPIAKGSIGVPSSGGVARQATAVVVIAQALQGRILRIWPLGPLWPAACAARHCSRRPDDEAAPTDDEAAPTDARRPRSFGGPSLASVALSCRATN